MKPSELTALREQRARKYRQDMVPYLRLASNYVPGMLFFGMFVLFLYDRLLEALPTAFPSLLVCALILTYGLNTVRVRTFLFAADLQYLLPLESRMSAFFRPSLIKGFVKQMIVTFVLWALLWPLYQLGPESQGRAFIGIFSVLLLLKGLTVWFWWEEQRIRDRRVQRAAAVIRAGVCYALLYLLLAVGIAEALAGIGISAISYVLVLGRMNKASVAWERLIAHEQRSQARWRAALKQFMDIPGEQSEVRGNPLTRLANWIPHKREKAYRYLYVITWLRSPIFGIMLRWSLIGAIIIYIADSLWLQAGIALVFGYVLRLQLKELAQVHRYDDWSFAFPIQDKDRASAIRTLCLQIWFVAMMVICVPMVV